MKFVSFLLLLFAAFVGIDVGVFVLASLRGAHHAWQSVQVAGGIELIIFVLACFFFTLDDILPS